MRTRTLFSWRNILIAAIVVLAAAMLVACGGASTPEPTQAPTPEPTQAPAAEPVVEPTAVPAAATLPEDCQGQDGTGLKVGFANLGESVPFAVQVREGIEKVAKECNLEVVNADNALDPQIALDLSLIHI